MEELPGREAAIVVLNIRCEGGTVNNIGKGIWMRLDFEKEIDNRFQPLKIKTRLFHKFTINFYDNEIIE